MRGVRLLHETWRQGIKRKHPIWVMRGVFRALGAIWHERRQRRPVPREIYRLSRRIVRGGGLPLEQVEPWLPPVAPAWPCPILQPKTRDELA